MCLYVSCMCAPVEARGGIRSHEAGVTDSYRLPYMNGCWEPNLCFLKEQMVLLTKEPSFHPSPSIFIYVLQVQGIKSSASILNIWVFGKDNKQRRFWKWKVSGNQFSIGNWNRRIFVSRAIGRDIWPFPSWFLMEAEPEFRSLSPFSGSFRTPHGLSFMAFLLNWRSALFSCDGW